MRPFSGFTIIELMVVLAIVAVLVALAIPGYNAWVLKANRGDAQQLLINWANNQEIWRSSDNDYASVAELAAPNHDRYAFTLQNRGVTTYTLVADATGAQEKDEEKSVSCDVMTIDQSGAKTPPACWQE